jgi:hypothetical protein
VAKIYHAEWDAADVPADEGRALPHRPRDRQAEALARRLLEDERRAPTAAVPAATDTSANRNLFATSGGLDGLPFKVSARVRRPARRTVA